jgi:putative transcriptional regulator
MTGIRVRHFVAALALLLVSTGAAPGSDRPDGPQSNGQSLAGQFLIATPEMADPRFRQTVVLMVQHNKDGAFGIVINRLAAEKPLASVLAALGMDEPNAEGNVGLYAGGPVQTEIGFVVHSADYRRLETVTVDDHVAVTSSPEVLRDIARKRGPQKSLIAFGYAGWGPGQLEHEMDERGWFTAPLDTKLLFDTAPDSIWEQAIIRRTRDL